MRQFVSLPVGRMSAVRTGLIAVWIALLAASGLSQSTEKRPWKLEDGKRFSSVSSTSLSRDGKWVGAVIRSPREGSRPGESRLVIYRADTGAVARTIPGVTTFRFVPEHPWILYVTTRDPAAAEKKSQAEKKKEEPPKRSARWQRMMERLKKQQGETPTPTPRTTSRTQYLTLEPLEGKKRFTRKGVTEYTLSDDGRHLFFVQSGTSGKHALYRHDLTQPDLGRARKILEEKTSIRGIQWQEKLGKLWFYSDRLTDAEKKKAEADRKKKAGATPKKPDAGKGGKEAPRKTAPAKPKNKKKKARIVEWIVPGQHGTIPVIVASAADHAAWPAGSDAWIVQEEEKKSPKAQEQEEEKKKAAGKEKKKPGRATPKSGSQKKAAAAAKSAKSGAAKAQTEKTEKAETAKPSDPVRLWSYDPGTGRTRVLVGPGVTRGFPRGQVLASGSSRMSRMMRGRTLPARFRAMAASFMSRGGVTLSRDGKRLFVRTMTPRPQTARSTPSSPAAPAATPTTSPARAAGRRRGGTPAAPTGPAGAATGSASARSTAPRKPEVVIWHWKDQLVPTEASRQRSRPSSPLYELDLGTGRLRLLSDGQSRSSFSPDQKWMLAHDSKPYGRFTSWDQGYADVYLTSVKSLKTEKIFARFAGQVQWTSDGRHLLWFQDGDWHAMSLEDRQRRNLTRGSGMQLGERGHGGGILMPDGRHVLLSDEHDVWQVPLDGSAPAVNLTKVGRRDHLRFRPVSFRSRRPDQNADEHYYADGRELHLAAFDTRTKAMGFYTLDVLTNKLEKRVMFDKYVSTPRQARDSDRVVFTLQDHDEYPDLWMSDRGFTSMRRLTRVNPWLDEIDLPESQLVEWRNLDGEPLQGILTLPSGYRSGKRYPLIVYIYEKLSDNLHRWRSPSTVYNVPMWAAQGYAVLQPDVIYDIGHPGPSSVKCVVPAVDKVVEMGIADPARVGLIGHSWGGYETAYIITQTRRFAAAVAGAPVVNMISAYNGIRWSSGKPRQFQYERTQSRIGGSLWEYPERFVENSPLFHLEKVTTPVLILFGDNDGAVPWYQGIEYMLAMRRLGKKAVFLQYKGEGHGLRKEWNKTDYDRRVLAWFDHFLRDHKPEPWIVNGQE